MCRRGPRIADLAPRRWWRYVRWGQWVCVGSVYATIAVVLAIRPVAHLWLRVAALVVFLALGWISLVCVEKRPTFAADEAGLRQDITRRYVSVWHVFNALVMAGLAVLLDVDDIVGGICVFIFTVLAVVWWLRGRRQA